MRRLTDTFPLHLHLVFSHRRLNLQILVNCNPGSCGSWFYISLQIACLQMCQSQSERLLGESWLYETARKSSVEMMLRVRPNIPSHRQSRAGFKARCLPNAVVPRCWRAGAGGTLGREGRADGQGAHPRAARRDRAFPHYLIRSSLPSPCTRPSSVSSRPSAHHFRNGHLTTEHVFNIQKQLDKEIAEIGSNPATICV